MTRKEQLLLRLLRQVLAVANEIAQPAKPAAVAPRGIYPHKSKYNPWRAYEWDAGVGKCVYLGAFPSITAARRAQREFRSGSTPSAGTRAANGRPALRMVGKHA